MRIGPRGPEMMRMCTVEAPRCAMTSRRQWRRRAHGPQPATHDGATQQTPRNTAEPPRAQRAAPGPRQPKGREAMQPARLQSYADQPQHHRTTPTNKPTPRPQPTDTRPTTRHDTTTHHQPQTHLSDAFTRLCPHEARARLIAGWERMLRAPPAARAAARANIPRSLFLAWATRLSAQP